MHKFKWSISWFPHASEKFGKIRIFYWFLFLLGCELFFIFRRSFYWSSLSWGKNSGPMKGFDDFLYEPEGSTKQAGLESIWSFSFTSWHTVVVVVASWCSSIPTVPVTTCDNYMLTKHDDEYVKVVQFATVPQGFSPNLNLWRIMCISIP